MPIYEYRCTSCGTELEKLQKISDPPLVECPECGKDTLTKLVSASSFRLKGSGWYETDFKTGKKKNGAGDNDGAPDSAKAATTDGGEGSGAKSDAKGGAETSAGKQRANDSGSGSESAGATRSAGADAAGASKARDSAGAASKPAPKE